MNRRRGRRRGGALGAAPGVAALVLGVVAGLSRALAAPAPTALPAASASAAVLGAPGASAAPSGSPGGPGAGDPPRADPATPSSLERSATSRRHFDNGIKLYRDTNYRGALVEFQAAHDLEPSAGALRNVALCQKTLFRYAEAADSLERLLREHGTQLTERERTTITAAIAELEGLVGRISLVVSPPDATVLIDGRAVSAEERAAGLRLNVGEHTLSASAPGHARVTRVISVASGQLEVPIELTLEVTMGFLTVTTSDPDAAIAVDGEARAFQRWTGPLPPGRHLVQVYKQGHGIFEQRVRIELGKSLEVVASAGPPTGPPTETSGGPVIQLDAPPPPPLPVASWLRQGWYAVGTLNILAVAPAPDGLEHSRGSGETEAGGATAGLRAGYRIISPLAVEALVEGGGFPVRGACDEGGPSCDTAQAVGRDYTLTVVRLGGNLRLLSGGERLRFASSIGSGTVRHELDIPASTADPSDGLMPARNARGWNPYFLLELGLELNLGHALLGAGATLNIDGTAKTQAGGGYQPYSGLFFPGLALRAGWSEWKPRPGSRFRTTTPPDTR